MKRCEEEEERRKKETARWTPVPHVSKQRDNPLGASILFSTDQSLVSPLFHKEYFAKIILGMALPHNVCTPISGDIDVFF